MLNEILPRLSAAGICGHFIAVGDDPLGTSFPASPPGFRFEHRGFVNELPPFYWAADVLVAPLLMITEMSVGAEESAVGVGVGDAGLCTTGCETSAPPIMSPVPAKISGRVWAQPVKVTRIRR